MQGWVAAGIDGHGEKRLEDIAQHLPKALHFSTLLVDAVQARDLDEPADILMGQTVHVEPACQACGKTAYAESKKRRSR